MNDETPLNPLVTYEAQDGVCVLRLNAPPVNTITFELLEALRAAVARANADAGVRGIVLTGAPAHFSAGADVDLFRQVVAAEDAIRVSRTFQEALQQVEGSPKPVVAAVAGKMMGSAVELPLACHYRVCAVGASFSMPEVRLGINPGAGGTQRLPRLIGLGPALRMLLTGEAVRTPQAQELGLVDAVCPPEELLDRAKAILAEAAPRRTSERTDRIADPASNDAAFEQAEKLLAAVRPEVIAPRKIVEAVRAGVEESVAAGMRAEQTVFAECMDTPAARNKIHLFFATRAMGKVPDLAGVEPGEVAKAGVIGMGSMGTGIAHALLIAGVPVVVRDADPAALRRGAEQIRRSVGKRVEQGKMAPGRAERMLSLLRTTTEWEALADTDLVIEAVFEDLAVKRSVIEAVESACRADALVATNTSTISLDRLAEPMRHPERLVGLHFFNPAHRMPLLEVIRREGASPRAVATAMAFARALRKTPVLVRNREGFLVNRIFVPYFKEAFSLLEDGADAREIDEAMVAFGFPMGPLTLIDMAGIDILVHVDRVMAGAFGRHGALSPIAARLAEGGFCGQKSGAGVYKYERGDRVPRRHEAAEAIVADVRRQRHAAPRGVDREEITRRLVLRMVSEAFYVLEEGIAQRESDIDAAMVLGTGFPDFRGGVLRYARDVGVASIRGQLDELAAHVGERFTPCKLLRQMEGAK